MFGSGELLVILLLILFLFGGKKLPELARSLGEGIREFKKACNGLHEEDPVRDIVPVKVEKVAPPEEKDDAENVKP